MRLHLAYACCLIILLPRFAQSIFTGFEDFKRDCQDTKSYSCVGIGEKHTFLTARNPDCVQDQSHTCSYLIYQLNNETKEYRFRMLTSAVEGSSSYYFAIGLSEDSSMGNDFVVYCAKTGANTTVVKAAENIGKESASDLGESPNQITVLNSMTSESGTLLFCDFELKAKLYTEKTNEAFDLKDGTYYLMLAKGRLKYGGGEVDYHGQDWAVSGEKINFNQVSEIGSKEPTRFALIIHVAGMIFAFTFFMPVGIVIGRYYKETWAKDHICYRRKWVLFHVVCNLSATACCIISVLAMMIGDTSFKFKFIFTDDSSHSYKTHAILGITTLVLLLYLCTTHWTYPVEARAKKVLAVIHSFLGVTCYIIGSLMIIMSTDWTHQAQTVTLCSGKQISSALAFCTYLTFNILMASYVAWTDSHMSVNCYRSFLSFPLDIVSNEEAPRPKLRKIILLTYACICALLTLVNLTFYIGTDYRYGCNWRSSA